MTRTFSQVENAKGLDERICDGDRAEDPFPGGFLCYPTTSNRAYGGPEERRQRVNANCLSSLVCVPHVAEHTSTNLQIVSFGGPSELKWTRTDRGALPPSPERNRNAISMPFDVAKPHARLKAPEAMRTTLQGAVVAKLTQEE